MKRFLKKRWHSIPVALVSALLVLLLTAGGVFAWYQVTEGTAEVTIDEAISYQVTGQTSGSFDAETSVWTVSMYPGETEILYMTVFNVSSADLAVVAFYTISPDDGELTVTGNDNIELDIPVTIPGGASPPFSIEVHASGNIPIRTYNVEFTLNRQSP